MAEGDGRVRDEFLSEAQEIIEGLGRDLLALDEGVRNKRVDPSLVNDVFRAVHTLKGLAGLFGATRMASVSHELEELLDHLRLGRVELTAEVLDMLFRSVQLYGRILQAEKEGRDQPMPEVDELIRDLHRGTGGPAGPSSVGEYDLDASLLAVLTEYEEHRLRTNIAQGMRLYRLRVQFQLATIDQALDELKGIAKPHGEIITYLPTGAGADADSIELDILMASGSTLDVLRGALDGRGVEIEEVARRAAAGGGGGGPPSSKTGRATGQIPRAASMPSIAPPPGLSGPVSPRSEQPAAPEVIAGQSKQIAPDLGTIRSVAQTVRVDINKLDRLMNIVGELSIVRTTLARLVERLRAQHVERELAADVQRLLRTFERHLGSMQQGILEVRMVPLGQVFDKLARVVRQISRDANKEVNLVITGAETEVDKLIVEELSDPLMHMMRNAIDHGIETRTDREAVGKPAVGTIALNAFQKGNHVVIEIEDDGRGMDPKALLDAAMRRGVIGLDEARGISRQEILSLVFIPGVSTKADVSELSGRGVGMDVVKTNIAKLGGVIDLQSEEGIGTKVTVTLPITLAIISALVVRISERLFAIPLANVQEAVVLDPKSVRVIEGREVVTLRGKTLQLCRLQRLFGLEGVVDGPNGWGTEASPPPEPGDRLREYVVVTMVGARRLGLVVGTLVGEQDVVIKALGPSLKGVRGFAGASELGDQRIALVIDAPALIEEMLAGGERLRSEPRGFHG
jgi:two-component system chemotaxis sensor kinase CheA